MIYFKSINKSCATSFNNLNVRNACVSGLHIKKFHCEKKKKTVIACNLWQVWKSFLKVKVGVCVYFT